MAAFRKIIRTKRCPLCLADTEVDYKDVALLHKYISERGKILNRARSGICTKHQRLVSLAIRRARYVALLPFVQS